jgi:predicted small secreted protein
MMGYRIGLVGVLIAALGLAACANTVRGAGRDIQKSGQAVERSTR